MCKGVYEFVLTAGVDAFGLFAEVSKADVAVGLTVDCCIGAGRECLESINTGRDCLSDVIFEEAQ